jgi:hypothetical protein
LGCCDIEIQLDHHPRTDTGGSHPQINFPYSKEKESLNKHMRKIVNNGNHLCTANWFHMKKKY